MTQHTNYMQHMHGVTIFDNYNAACFIQGCIGKATLKVEICSSIAFLTCIACATSLGDMLHTVVKMAEERTKERQGQVDFDG